MDDEDDEDEAPAKSSTANGRGAASGPDGVGAKGEGEDEQGPLFELPEDMNVEDAMAAMMGFSSFESTKGTAVEDNQKGAAKGAARQVLSRKYRQYMNRKGGFDRKLDAIK